MNRKYRQPGYDDSDRDAGRKKRDSKPKFREGPRSPRMTSFQKVIRCAQCGSALPASFNELTESSQCPQCDTPLHSCRNCVYFDPGARFECSQPVEKRIAKKDAGNDCSYFEIKARVEKEVGSNPATKAVPDDPRDAFERLFKK